MYAYFFFIFIVKLMHVKVLNRWSNKSFDMLLQILKKAFPEGANIPASYYDAKKMLRDLGLGYEMTDPLPNDRKSAGNFTVTSQPSSLDRQVTMKLSL